MVVVWDRLSGGLVFVLSVMRSYTLVGVKLIRVVGPMVFFFLVLLFFILPKNEGGYFFAGLWPLSAFPSFSSGAGMTVLEISCG